MSQSSEKLTFGLVHGSWHGAWCWEYLQDELEAAGHDTVAVDLPIEDPKATFEDYAGIVAHSLSGVEAPVLVGHSRAGNVIPRVAGKIAVKKLIYLCSSFEPSTLSAFGYYGDDELPHRNPPDYHEGIVSLPGNQTVYNSELAKHYFFHDCEPEERNRAAAALRPQRKPIAEPPLRTRPEVSSAYIVGANDRIVRREWSEHVSRTYLGVEPVEIESGHSPFLSVPRELARLILEVTENE